MIRIPKPALGRHVAPTNVAENLKYRFTITYHRDGAQHALNITVLAKDDLQAFASLCRSPKYQDLDRSEFESLLMTLD